MNEILDSKWLLPEVYGDKKAEQQGLCIYKNCFEAIQIINKHVLNHSITMFHCDVDFDGTGSGYIAIKYLKFLGIYNRIINMNKAKVHGICSAHPKFVELYNQRNPNEPIELVFIVDSSSNCVEELKEFPCDVIVVDHHKVTHNDTYGYTKTGHKYVIVNNCIENENFDEDIKKLASNGDNSFLECDRYIADSRESCGVVLYELFRVYGKYYKCENILRDSLLEQWAGATLLTDKVDTRTERNAWYMQRTVHCDRVEPTIKIILGELNKYIKHLNKSFIEFTFVPLINKAIRAGKGSEVINIICDNPKDILSLKQYEQQQAEALLVADVDTNPPTQYIMKEIDEKVISTNYCGLIAQFLCDRYNKNAACFRVLENGKVKGSFRGRTQAIDYNAEFNKMFNGSAEGHEGAFGFEMEREELEKALAYVSEIDKCKVERMFMSIGNIDQSLYGVWHISNIDKFREMNLLCKIAYGNSMVSSSNEIKILASAKDGKLIEQKGKIYIYNFYGIECKAFEPLDIGLVYIYPEYQNALECYIKKLN